MLSAIMSGHSRWTQVKHKKAGSDAKRGALFSKLGRLIAVAAKEGGPNPETNFKLRQAMDQARSAGLPKDNIERAVARAKGGEETDNLSPVEYEAYGPGASAFLISGLTDNPNRTTGEIKRLLDEHGGRLATSGSVAWIFERRIILEFPAEGGKSEDVELALIDAGAEDTNISEAVVRAIVAPEKYEEFSRTVGKLGLTPTTSVFAALPKNVIHISAGDQTKADIMAEALENHPDINDVWTNIAEL